LQAADTLHWPARAVQDTVATIAREAAYRRDYAASLLQRLLRWLIDLISRFEDSLGHPNFGRIILLAGVVVLVLLGVRFVLAMQAGADEFGRAGGRVSVHRGRDPWLEAQRLAAAGDFTAAAHALYAALLARLAGRGAVRLHPSKTAGDYSRELRRRGASEQAPFHAFRVHYDRLIYGAGQCSADEYEQLLVDARPLLERAA
jgi:Domain of unknown function (DUF4129)